MSRRGPRRCPRWHRRTVEHRARGGGAAGVVRSTPLEELAHDAEAVLALQHATRARAGRRAPSGDPRAQLGQQRASCRSRPGPRRAITPPPSRERARRARRSSRVALDEVGGAAARAAARRARGAGRLGRPQQLGVQRHAAPAPGTVAELLAQQRPDVLVGEQRLGDVALRAQRLDQQRARRTPGTAPARPRRAPHATARGGSAAQAVAASELVARRSRSAVDRLARLGRATRRPGPPTTPPR